jgi:hypothetical protein
MILSTHGLIASQITQFVGLLDVYSGAAAAYSLRKLRTAYTGSAIRVRRTNLDEADIGFTSSGELDTTALLAFTGTGALDNGFVTTWYDQSGNSRNATQATALNQPQIVSSGSVIVQNGKPTVDFKDNTDILSFSGTTSTSINNTMVTVQKFNTPLTGYRTIFAIGTSSATISVPIYAHIGWGVSPFQRAIYKNGTDQSLNGNYTSNQELWSSKSQSNLRKFYLNNNNQSITNSTTNITSNLSLIVIGNDSFFSALLGNTQECIFWNSTKSDSDLSGINTNINDFYSIY